MVAEDKKSVTAVVVLGLSLGLWGIGWGLPSSALVEKVFPPLDAPEFRETLISSWQGMHRRLGENLMLNPRSFDEYDGAVSVMGGWDIPPEILWGSARSFHIRSEHEDEQTILIMLSKLKPHRLELNPHMFTYGAAHVYAVGAFLAAGWSVGLVPLHRGLLPYLEEPARMASMYRAGRLVSVAAYVGSALILLSLGRKYWDRPTGLLAALLFLLTPAAILQANVLKNHAFWTFWALLTVYKSADALAGGRTRDYLWAGAASGVTVGSFLTGWPSCVVVAAAGLLRTRFGHPWRKELRGVLLAATAAVAAFIITNPYWLFSFNEALAEMKVLSNQGGFNLANPVLFVSGALRRASTAPFLVLMLAGVVLGAWRGRRDPLLALCACAFLAGLAAVTTIADVSGTSYVRYFAGWAAVGCLLASRTAVEWWRRRHARSPARALLVAAGVYLAAHGLTYAHNFSVASSQESTHWRAGRWVEENIPEGAQIGLLRLPQPSNCPFFRFDRYNLLFIKPALFKDVPSRELPEYLALTLPTYDDRPLLGDNLRRYELAASFDRARLLPWIKVDESAMTANPLIEIYRLKHG